MYLLVCGDHEERIVLFGRFGCLHSDQFPEVGDVCCPYSVRKMPHVLTKSARWNSWPIFRQKIRGNPRYIWLNQWIDILGLWLPSLKINKVTGIIQKFSISTCQFVTCYCFICFCHGKNSTFWHRLVAIPTSKSKRQRMRTCPSSDENSDLCQTLAANFTFFPSCQKASRSCSWSWPPKVSPHTKLSGCFQK